MTIDAPPAAWNADARSRAQTRGLLMALSRDHGPYFALRTPRNIVMTVATLTLEPLVRDLKRFRRRRRAEWALLSEFAGWVGQFVPAQEHSMSMRRLADKCSANASRTGKELSFNFAFGLLFSAVPWTSLLLDGATSTGKIWMHAPATYIGWLALVFSCIAALWIVVLCRTIQFDGEMRFWLTHCNKLLLADGRRPVIATPSRWIVVVAAVLLLLIVPLQQESPWPFFLIAAIGAQWLRILQIDAARRIHLQLIERLLEWMDDSGMPVEFDVVALNPDEIAAMIA